MAQENVQLMEAAKASLKGRWGLAIGSYLIYTMVTGAPGALGSWGIATLLIAGPMALGSASFALAVARGHDARLQQMFDGFKRFSTALATYLLMMLYVLLWLLALIVPGIIAALSYSMTFYILADDPTRSPQQALHRSRQMMEGHKARLFGLFLRFAALALLCVLTLGIGFLWFIPFANITMAKFYDDLKNSSNHNN